MDKFPAAVPDLLEALRALRIDNPKATKSSVHLYPAELYAPDDSTATDRRVTSWKMTEHMYFKKDNGFPTLARGLFTERVTSNDEVPPAAMSTFPAGSKVAERIVARGYDKFFNTDEMAWTSVSTIWHRGSYSAALTVATVVRHRDALESTIPPDIEVERMPHHDLCSLADPIGSRVQALAWNYNRDGPGRCCRRGVECRQARQGGQAGEEGRSQGGEGVEAARCRRT